MTYQKKQDEEKVGVKSVVTAVTVAAVGTGIAVAGAFALKDKKNRDKIKEAVSSVKDQGEKYMNGKQDQAKEKKEKVEKKLDEGKKSVKKIKREEKS